MVDILERINTVVWGLPALVLILGVGIYLSVRTGFAQFRLFPESLRLFVRRLCGRGDSDGASPFRALCTALAATVGTGNLAGVAGAMAIGGPGSVFWMWICALVGMVTKYAEAMLAVGYQMTDGTGQYAGGPMYIITRGLGAKWRPLAICYCFLGVVASFGVGNCTQINAVMTGLQEMISAYGIPISRFWNPVMGLFLGVLVFFMLRGGAEGIGKIAEMLVPFAAVVYILLALGVLLLRAERIPDALMRIVSGAFDPRAVTGGAVGSAFMTLRVGVSRGVFTNEAGMGTASIAHGSARVSHPVEQGMMGIMEVFLDTLVICTLTALVILVSGVRIPFGFEEGMALTSRAFSAVYGDWVSILLAIEVCCFALATILGWGFYGIRCGEFLFGEKLQHRFALLQGGVVVLGAVLRTEVVWLLSEIVNGLMALPNLMALALLTPEVVRLTREFMRRNSV